MKTICALATPKLNAAIHIIRISGFDAFEIINKIINKEIVPKGFKIFRRFIVDNGNKIDDVLINTFIGPKSFTGENLVEINCHGGLYLADKIINLLVKHGAYHAERGEFTKRAFLNNKLDIMQAEAINNLIFASNDISISGAISTISGELNTKINDIKNKLLSVLGIIEVSIDYPEYDESNQHTNEDIVLKLQQIHKDLNELIQNSKNFIPLNDGIKIAIIGKPNVGKSSLMNNLIKEDKAIVSNIEGTTRDIVESSININGITLKFYDTAGIRKTNDEIETIGINKTFDLIDKVDLILWLSDDYNNFKDEYIINKLKNKVFIQVLTKIDLNKNIEYDSSIIGISSKLNQTQSLIDEIKNKFHAKDFEKKTDICVLQSNKQIQSFEKINQIIYESYSSINQGATIDLIANNLEEAYREINLFLGNEKDYDFFDDLFKNFCLGK